MRLALAVVARRRYREAKFDRVIEDFNKAIELDPDFISAYFNRGKTYCEKGDFDRAFKDFNKAMKLSPENAPNYYYRGVCQLRLQNWQAAHSDLIAARATGAKIWIWLRDSVKTTKALRHLSGNYDVQLPQDIAAVLTP